MITNEIPQELLNSVIYCENSKTGLLWKITNLPAGSKTTKSYQVRFRGKQYHVHRIILTLLGFNCDNKVVDHINGCPFDNRFANLRICDQAENTRNRKLPKTNKSGSIGVHRHIKGAWVATWSDSIKKYSKSFSANKYGEDEAKELAVSFRNKKIKELQECDIIYSDRHGLKVDEPS